MPATPIDRKLLSIFVRTIEAPFQLQLWLFRGFGILPGGVPELQNHVSGTQSGRAAWLAVAVQSSHLLQSWQRLLTTLPSSGSRMA